MGGDVYGTLPWIVGPWLPQQPQTTLELIEAFVPGVWPPTFAAIILIAYDGGSARLRREIYQRFRSPEGTRLWLAVAFVVPAAGVFAGIGLARAAGAAQPFVPFAGIGNILLITLMTGAVGEELGWRGFMLSRLEQYMTRRSAALVMATLWTSHLA
jgi:membrane protease YdiL (CAAX protease family)